MAEKFAGHHDAFSIHDGMAGIAVPQVVKADVIGYPGAPANGFPDPSQVLRRLVPIVFAGEDKAAQTFRF